MVFDLRLIKHLLRMVGSLGAFDRREGAPRLSPFALYIIIQLLASDEYI